MNLRPFLFSALLLLSACTDKYPFEPQFVAPSDLSEQVLTPPPAMGSKEVESEILSIVSRQAALSPAQKEQIIAENKISPEMIVQPVLGKRFTRESHPALYQLLNHAGSDAWRLADVNQDYWKSPRPWMADKRVELLAPKITSYGYPSGHTTTNTVWAHVLGELFAAKKAAFIARANEIATHRMQGGVHFPHDLAGGRALAKAIFEKMKTSSDFKRELNAARQELRGKVVVMPEDDATPSRCSAMRC